MRFLFAVYCAGCFAAGCLGAYHQFGVAAICLVAVIAFESEHRRNKNSRQ